VPTNRTAGGGKKPWVPATNDTAFVVRGDWGRRIRDATWDGHIRTKSNEDRIEPYDYYRDSCGPDEDDDQEQLQDGVVDGYYPGSQWNDQ
jgi:hypothetical protein